MISVAVSWMGGWSRGCLPFWLLHRLRAGSWAHTVAVTSGICAGSRFRLRAHTLNVEIASWEDGISPMCDQCPCVQIQEEAHDLFMCRYEGLCALRQKVLQSIWDFIRRFSPAHPFLQHQLSVQAVSNFLLQRNKKLFYFISELLDLLIDWTGFMNQADVLATTLKPSEFCEMCMFGPGLCAHSQPLHLTGTILALKRSWNNKLPEHILRFVKAALCD
eukprot:1153819-Pelagomonas_calceolata.AAC.1